MRASFCVWLSFAAVACTQQLDVLDRDATGSSKRCMCEDQQLCAVERCVEKAGITSFSAGYRHTCRVEDGELSCWGENRAGQLGVGDSQERMSPTRVGDDSSWLEVAASEEHTCAISSPGRLYCWGNNRSGQLGTKDSAPQTTPRRVGSYDDFVRVFCGGDSTCALRSGGALYCWGATGQLLAGSGDVATPVVVDEPIEVVNGTMFREVALGGLHACGVRQDRALVCWGQNGDGQLGIGMAAESVRLPAQVMGERWEHVAASQHHTCGIRDGTLLCWGRGDSGELGIPNRRRVAFLPQRVGDGNEWNVVDAGGSHSCAINDAKRLFCWGRNVEGQLGMTPTNSMETPVLVSPNIRYAAVSLGATHSCALDTGGVLYCWGNNDVGQLGLGDHMQRMQPTQLE